MAKSKKENNNLITSKYTMARIAPRKVSLVANEIRGKNIDEAIRFLDFNNRKASGIIKGVVNSAVSNGVNNKGLEKDSMYIADVKVGPGPIRKAGRFAGRGTFKPIAKRTTHITVVLDTVENAKEMAEASSEEVEVVNEEAKQ